MAEFRIVDHEDMDLSAALFVIGFPSTGYVGTIATSFLVESLNLQRVASIHSDDFPPMAVVRDGRSLSPMRIYAAPMVCGIDGECSQLAVVASELGPKPQNMYPLGRTLLEWARRKHVKQVVSVEGMQLEGKPAEDVEIYGIAGMPAGRQGLEALKVKPLLEGIVSGFSGALLQLAEAVGMNVVCLLAATQGQQQDAQAAAQIVDLLRPMVPKLTIDPEPLRRQAEAMDQQIKKMVRRHEESMTAMSEQSQYMYG